MLNLKFDQTIGCFSLSKYADLHPFIQSVSIELFFKNIFNYFRRNYLIRTLPHSIRNRLLNQRKYIFAVHEVATRLAYIGVLQFGPQKLKEKDQVFLYLNRQASIVDTTTSSPGYHQVEAEVNYPQECYTLSSLGDVEQFWHRSELQRRFFEDYGRGLHDTGSLVLQLLTQKTTP